MARHLVIGASGLVGSHLRRALRDAGHEVIGTRFSQISTGLPHLDIRDVQKTVEFITACRPEVIYVPAANPNVDYCERKPQETHEINVLGVSHVIKAAETLHLRGLQKPKVVYFSSDYVFDGACGPYSETATVCPTSYYGHQKVSAERIAHYGINLIVRTTHVFGHEPKGKNFATQVLTSIQQQIRFKAVFDQLSTPIHAADLTKTVVELVGRGAIGVFHVAGRRITSKYLFARAAAGAFALDPGWIVPVSSTELHQIAQRPTHGGLLVNKVEAFVGRRMPDFIDGLEIMASEVPPVEEVPPNPAAAAMQLRG